MGFLNTRRSNMGIYRRAAVLVLVLSTATPALAQKDKGEGGDDKPLATAKHEQGLVVEILEVRPDKSKDLLTIRWRYKNPTKKAVVVLEKSGVAAGSSGYPWLRFVKDTYFLQGEGDTTYRYSIAKDTGNKYWVTPKIGRAAVVVKPEGEVEFWAKFELPKSEKISLHLPDVPPIEDIPVQKKPD
jgi:hypothetical protein